MLALKGVKTTIDSREKPPLILVQDHFKNFKITLKHVSSNNDKIFGFFMSYIKIFFMITNDSHDNKRFWSILQVKTKYLGRFYKNSKDILKVNN